METQLLAFLSVIQNLAFLLFHRNWITTARFKTMEAFELVWIMSIVTCWAYLTKTYERLTQTVFDCNPWRLAEFCGNGSLQGTAVKRPINRTADQKVAIRYLKSFEISGDSKLISSSDFDQPGLDSLLFSSEKRIRRRKNQGMLSQVEPKSRRSLVKERLRLLLINLALNRWLVW